MCFMRQITQKQIIKNQVWHRVKRDRIDYLTEKYNYLPCEYCKKNLQAHIIQTVEAHHIDKDRNNNTPENCYIVFGECHSFITDNNIHVKQEDFQGLR